MSQTERLSRESLICRENLVYRGVPNELFMPFVHEGEQLESLSGDQLSARLLESFRNYTHASSLDGMIGTCDTSARETPAVDIKIIPFTVDKQADSSTIISPKVSGDAVIHLGGRYRSGLSWEESLTPEQKQTMLANADPFIELGRELLLATKRHANIPGSMLWYEALISQFSYVPPGESVNIGEESMSAGPNGTFILLDIDPKHTITPINSEDNRDFLNKLDFQILLLSNEIGELEDILGTDAGLIELCSPAYEDSLSALGKSALSQFSDEPAVA